MHEERDPLRHFVMSLVKYRESRYVTVLDMNETKARKTLVRSLNSPLIPPHIGAEPGRAKRRVQDNLHAHARNEPIKNY